MSCLYKGLVLIVKFSGWLARRALDAFVALLVLEFDQRATVTFWAYGYESSVHYSDERRLSSMAPTPSPVLLPGAGVHHEPSTDDRPRDHVTIFDVQRGPLALPMEDFIGYMLYIVVMVYFWVAVFNAAVNFLATSGGNAAKRICSCAHGGGAPSAAEPGAGGTDEEQARGQCCCCSKRAGGPAEEAGEFRAILEREVQELEIPTADAIFGGVNGLVQKLKSLNDAIVDLATSTREALGEPQEEQLLWKDWVATKTRCMKESVMTTAKGEVDWKSFLPKIDLARLAVGEFSITMPQSESVVAGSAAGKFMDVFKNFANKIVDLVTSEMPDLIPEVGNVVSEAASLDPSALQEEVASVVGSNPFKILGILSAIKNNTAIALGLKNCIEVIIHNVSTLLNGLKDGMYKGLYSPAPQRPAPGLRADRAKGAKDAKEKKAAGEAGGAAAQETFAV